MDPSDTAAVSASASGSITCHLAGPTATKTAVTTYKEVHTWTVAKSLTPLTQDAGAGETVGYAWDVTIGNTYVENTFKVAGEITIVNPNEWQAIMLTGLTDVVDNGGTCTVDPAPYIVPKKVGGVPAHRFARRNQTVDLAAAKVQIDSFDMVDLDGSLLSFRVVCSPGTYVRSLVHNLGQRLGCGAHLTAIRVTWPGIMTTVSFHPASLAAGGADPSRR